MRFGSSDLDMTGKQGGAAKEKRLIKRATVRQDEWWSNGGKKIAMWRSKWSEEDWVNWRKGWSIAEYCQWGDWSAEEWDVWEEGYRTWLFAFAKELEEKHRQMVKELAEKARRRDDEKRKKQEHKQVEAAKRRAAKQEMRADPGSRP